MLRTLLLGVIALTFAAPLPGFQKKPPPHKSTVNPDAAVIADFVKRVDAYAALHKKLEGTLPALPKQTTPQQMDAHERALAKLIQEGRATAKQGDLFTPGMQRLVRRGPPPGFPRRARAPTTRGRPRK